MTLLGNYTNVYQNILLYQMLYQILRIQQSYSLTNKFNNLHTIDHSDIHEQDIFISGPQTIIENGIYICSEVDIYDMAMASS